MSVVVLRHPIDRLISQYNYVCVEGKEGRKKWLPSWKEKGQCPLTLLQFLDTDLTSETFLIDHLARAGDGKCGVKFAFENLSHNCVRFLLLDKLSDGLFRLSKVWGPAMQPHLFRMSQENSKKNHSPYPERVRSQAADPKIMKELNRRLRLDIEFYEAALAYYETQWERPLLSCTDFQKK